MWDAKGLKACIKWLVGELRQHEVSSNYLLLLGSLDYCLIVLDNLEKGQENIQEALLILINNYLDKTLLIRDIVEDTDELMELNLSSLKDDFDYIQEVTSVNSIFPRLDDDDLDLSLLLKK